MAQSKNSRMDAAAQINDGAKLLYPPDAHTAAPTKNATPSIFSGERAATRTNDGAVHLHPDAHTASQIKTVYDFSAEPAAAYYNYSEAVAGEALPLASQVFGGKTASTCAAGLPVLAISVASLAVAGLAAGEPTPAVGFGLFLMLIGGLATVSIRVLRA